MTLAQIAVECGFHDQPHFTRAFQRRCRMTPAMYLRRGRAPSIEQVFTIAARGAGVTVGLWIVDTASRSAWPSPRSSVQRATNSRRTSRAEGLAAWAAGVRGAHASSLHQLPYRHEATRSRAMIAIPTCSTSYADSEAAAFLRSHARRVISEQMRTAPACLALPVGSWRRSP